MVFVKYDVFSAQKHSHGGSSEHCYFAAALTYLQLIEIFSLSHYPLFRQTHFTLSHSFSLSLSLSLARTGPGCMLNSRPSRSFGSPPPSFTNRSRAKRMSQSGQSLKPVLCWGEVSKTQKREREMVEVNLEPMRECVCVREWKIMGKYSEIETSAHKPLTICGTAQTNA